MGRKGEARRQQILDAARQILLEQGPDGLVLRDVAERLGITHGNLQYYFRTRQSLLVAIFDQEVAKYTENMKSAVAATSSKRGRLDAIIDSGLALLRTPETALWHMLWSMAGHSTEMAVILKKENDLYEASLAKELKSVAPHLTAQRRTHLAKIIRALLDGISIQLINEKADSATTKALQNEMKSAVLAIVEAG
jgi:AcrR family transcriptional regulator